VSLGTFMLLLHGGAMATGLIWLVARHNNLSLRALWPRRTMTGKTA
jgi:hypothetical protein